MPAKPHTKGVNHWSRLLLLLPFIALSWVPAYNRIEPELAGIPFFYWYQLGWIVMGAVLLGLVYALEAPARREGKR